MTYSTWIALLLWLLGCPMALALLADDVTNATKANWLGMVAWPLISIYVIVSLVWELYIKGERP